MTNAFSLFSDLKDRIAHQEARIATVGLGYVGLPLALTISEAGFPTTGIDLNESRVAAINAGERVISYFAADRIRDAVAGGRFGATADFAVLQDIDVVLICVPTPLSPAREPDLSYVVRAAEGIAQWLRPGQLVVLESTVWPGATVSVHGTLHVVGESSASSRAVAPGSPSTTICPSTGTSFRETLVSAPILRSTGSFVSAGS